MPKDFNPAEALDLLDEIERLHTAYGALTARSAVSDIDLRIRLTDHRDSGTLVADPDNAMVAIYASGQEVSIFSDDDHWAEACWFGFTDDVQKLIDGLGMYVDEPPAVPFKDEHTVTGFDVMAVRETRDGMMPAGAEDADAWGVYVTYDGEPTMHVEDYDTRTKAEHVAALLAEDYGVPARTLPYV